MGIVFDAKTRAACGVQCSSRGTVRGYQQQTLTEISAERISTERSTISFSLIGYTTQTIHQISIQPDTALHLDVPLTQAPIQTYVAHSEQREQSLRDVPVECFDRNIQNDCRSLSVTLDDGTTLCPRCQYDVG